MSSLADPKPDPPAVDEIVAYLDGELPPQECRRVENRLATDEDYRQQLHELDRAWEALDALPTTTVGDDFAQTTIELACVAANDDFKQHAEIVKAVKRNRAWRWIVAGIAATVVGVLAGRALIPDRNEELVADLPAIHQVNVLPYVTNVEFLRQLSALVPLDRMFKDKSSFDLSVKELDRANSASLDERRDWVRSLPPEQKAELVDRVRAFGDQPPTKQQQMRAVMADIQNAQDKPQLQKTLIAYGHWLSRRTAGQEEQLSEELERTPPDKQADVVRRRIERDSDLALRHLEREDAETLRSVIFQIAKEKRPDFMDRISQGRKMGSAQKVEEQFSKQAAMIVLAELFKGNLNSRQEMQNGLVRKLSPKAREHWESLGRRQFEYNKPRQLLIWVRDAMNLKVDPEELERFFANDEKIPPDKRQELLNQPRAQMEATLERLYFSSELGIDISQLGEPGGAQRKGLGPLRQPGRPNSSDPGGPAGPDGLGPRRRFSRPPGQGPGPDRRPPTNPQPPAPNHSPTNEGKPEAI